MRLLRLCKTSHLNIHEKLPSKIKQLNRTVAWRNCPCPNASPWEIKRLFCGSARKQGANPSPNPWPTPREMSRSNRFFFPMGTAPRITKLLMKNTLLRWNRMAWWVMLSLGSSLGSDLSSAERFAFRLAGLGRRCISHISPRCLCPQTPKQHSFFLFLPVKRLIWFQRFQNPFTAQKSASSARPECACPIPRLERKHHPQHIFCKWPFKMSNEHNDNFY